MKKGLLIHFLTAGSSILLLTPCSHGTTQADRHSLPSSTLIIAEPELSHCGPISGLINLICEKADAIKKVRGGLNLTFASDTVKLRYQKNGFTLSSTNQNLLDYIIIEDYVLRSALLPAGENQGFIIYEDEIILLTKLGNVYSFIGDDDCPII